MPLQKTLSLPPKFTALFGVGTMALISRPTVKEVGVDDAAIVGDGDSVTGPPRFLTGPITTGAGDGVAGGST